MRRLTMIYAVVGLIAAIAGTAQADLDVNGIYMSSCNDFQDGVPEDHPWNFEIWIDFDNTGDLNHIDVTPPAGATPFTIEEEDGYWEHGSTHYLTLVALQSDYPTGSYTLNFRDSNNMSLDSVTLDYSGIVEPCSPVDFIYPENDGDTIGIDPTFEWNVSSSDGNALGMWVLDSDDEDVYEDVPVSMDTLEWTPGSLDPNSSYELEVSVFGVKDPLPGPALPTALTNGSDEFKYGLLIEYINTTGFTTVPEPATVALFGLGSLALLRRKRNA